MNKNVQATATSLGIVFSIMVVAAFLMKNTAFGIIMLVPALLCTAIAFREVLRRK